MKKVRTRKQMTAVLLCFVMVISTLLSYLYLNHIEDATNIRAAEIDCSQYTEDNPLKIVEIVPYIMFAGFGYHIAGGEIVDYDLIGDTAEKLMTGEMTLPSGVSSPESFVTGTGMVGIVRVTVSGKQLVVLYSREMFKRGTLGFKVEDPLLAKQAVGKRLTKEINDSNNTPAFIQECKTLLASSYTLSDSEQKILDELNAVHVEYKAVLMSEVEANPSIIADADLVFMSATEVTSGTNNLRAYLKKSYASKLKGGTDKYYIGSSSYESACQANPFYSDSSETPSWKTIQSIFELCTDLGGPKIVMQKALADELIRKASKMVTVNYTYLTSDGSRVASEEESSATASNNRIFKLFLMLYAKDSYEFRDDYYRYVDDNGNFTLQKDDAKSYWAAETFFDYNGVGNGNSSNSYDNKYDNVTKYTAILLKNGFVWNTDYGFSGTFSTNEAVNIRPVADSDLIGDTYTNGNHKFDESVFDHFDANKNSLTSAEALAFLLASQKEESHEKDSFRILDIEPSNEFELTENNFKSYLGGFKGTVKVDRMTSMEFNASDTDLIGTYDLIYMGANTGGLSTKHNNSAFDDMIYTHTGDKIETSLKSGDEYYSGNDITTNKLKELQGYENVGLPLILAQDLYNCENIDSASNMYTFLKNISFEKKVAFQVVNEYLCITRGTSTALKMLSFLNKERPGITVTSASYRGDSFTVSFKLGGVSKELKESYVAKLYLDVDGDGRLESDSFATKNIDSKKNVTFTITTTNAILKEASDSMLYRVVVASDNAKSSRSSAKGQAARNGQNNVRVLQIAPDTNNTIDLTSKSEIVGQKIATINDRYNINVKSMTVSEFVALYNPGDGGKAYDSSDLLTDQLMKYDVIVFGFSADYPVISNANGALDNVINFLGQDKSVIFTSGVLTNRNSYPEEKTKKAYDSLRSLAGMNRYESSMDKAYAINDTSKTYTSEGYSYAMLNQHKASGSIYSMFNITGSDLSQASSYRSKYITKVNIGHVTEYPYDIKEEAFAQKTNSGGPSKELEQLPVANELYGDYQLDLESTNKIVGYYALANNDVAGRKTYSVSPNDIRNNYYLYNNKHLWYSGIGQTSLTENEIEEAKLFVNTLVAAYMMSVKSPYVEFVDVHIDKEGNNLAFINSDVHSTEIKNDFEATFIPIDPMKESKGLKTSIYLQVGTDLHEIKTVRLADSSTNINLETTRLVSGRKYVVKIPKEYLTSGYTFLYVYVDNDYSMGYNVLELKRRNDFDLD